MNREASLLLPPASQTTSCSGAGGAAAFGDLERRSFYLEPVPVAPGGGVARFPGIGDALGEERGPGIWEAGFEAQRVGGTLHCDLGPLVFSIQQGCHGLRPIVNGQQRAALGTRPGPALWAPPPLPPPCLLGEGRGEARAATG